MKSGFGIQFQQVGIMRVIKVAYNNDTNFIVDIVKSIEGKFIVEFFNLNKRKEIKSVRGIQTELGTTNLPLIAFLDENLELVDAIWPENSPDWAEEIKLRI